MLGTYQNRFQIAARLLTLLAATAFLGCPGGIRFRLPDEFPPNFEPFTTTNLGVRITHSVYVPPNYDPNVPWPLIVWLHGAGEKGLDGRAPAYGALARSMGRHPERFPTLILFPQAPFGYAWGDRKEIRSKAFLDASDILTDAINFVTAQYNVDPDRISLTGISMGGFGVFYYGAAHADRFAAFMPLGGGGCLDLAPALTGAPLWAFQGEDDLVAPVENVMELVEAINAAGGDAALTIFPGKGHDIWGQVYGEPAVIDWLLAQRRD